MKQSQWTIALVLLVVLVFGVTFTLQYLGNTDPGDRPDRPTRVDSQLLDLAFFEPQFPPREDQPPTEQEQGENGYHDFWFVNDNPRAVGLWLKRESCKCSDVLAFLAPSEWVARQSAQQEGQADAKLSEKLRPLVRNVDKDPEAKKMLAKVEGIKLEGDVHVKVPARALGWVRVTWRGDRQGAAVTAFSADLWMDQKDSSNVATVRAGVRFVPALRVAEDRTERDLNELSARNLPFKMDITYWSGIRSELSVTPRMVTIRKDRERDPFVVGKPVALKESERAALQEQLTRAGETSRVRCAYKVPVEIRDRSKDGKTFLDIGPFRRQVELVLEGKEEPAAVVTLTGRIQGDLGLSTDNQYGQILFKEFLANRGKTRRVTIWSDKPDVKLEVDQERTARFLKVHVPEKPELGEGGRRTWTLTVEIPPKAVYGRFPADDNEKLRDCAVYLKTGRDQPTLRIPVSGVANLE